MILSLHGASGGDPDAHKSTACLVEPGMEILNAFILSPNGGADLWYDNSNLEKVATLMYLVKKYWPVNLNKIAVTGYSNGGNGSWYFGETQSATLSAAIPMASSYNVFRPDSTIRKMNIPFYVIHGQNDELFPLEETQSWVEATQSVGSDVTFVVAPGLGHYTPCDYVPYLQQAAVWLRDTVWAP
jgi:predicted esterase